MPFFLPCPRRGASFHGLLLGIALAAARVQAQPLGDSACAGVRLRLEGALAARWLEPVLDACEALRTMRDRDPSATLRVVAAGDDVIVEVTLGDGRATMRRVHAPSDLTPTVEALVAVPPDAAPTRLPARAAAPQVAVPPTPLPRLEPVRQPAPRRFDIEIGASVVSRLAGPPRYASVGVSGYAGLRGGPWLLALNGRYDGYYAVLEHQPRHFEMTTAGGGFSLLRELAAGHKDALELGLGTWLLGETQAYTPEGAELAFSSFDVRAFALARWLIGTKPLRGLVSLDGEVSPSRVRHVARTDEHLPTLPAWSVGLAAGIAWEPQ